MNGLHDLLPRLTPDKVGQLLRLGVLVVAGIPLVFVVSRRIKRLTLKKFSAQQAMVFEKIVLYGGLIAIAYSILNEFGFKMSHLLGAAGIVGIAVGFASQTSFSNIISGLFLIVERPFEVGDVITVGQTTGVVLTIDILSIKLRTVDNVYVRIPNETLIKSEVTNITRFPIRRVNIAVGVAYKEDIPRVRRLLLAIAADNPLCLNEPAPQVVFMDFGNSSLDLSFSVWAARQDWLAVKNSVMDEIKKRCDQEGIELPFPHLSLYSGSATGPLPIRVVNDQAGD